MEPDRGKPAAPGYEGRDANVRWIVRLGLGLAVLTLLVVLGMRLLFDFFVSREKARDLPPPPLAGSRAPYTGPRLQVAPAVELGEMRAAEEAILESYGWVDRDAGRVRIPIERAMDLIVERRLPAREASPQGSERP
jgi:hypothetical protein